MLSYRNGEIEDGGDLSQGHRANHRAFGQDEVS